MSSSCVPPKNCVVHDPDPGNHDHDNEDSRSECGSLCTCTSSSMTSIATSVSRDPRGSSASLSPTPTSGTPAQSAPNGSPAQQSSDNPFIVVFVPPQMLSSRQGCGTCGSCYNHGALKTALRVITTTLCEFCPWVAGFVIIYYTFWWWGLGPGFSAFLLMMGAHAFFRLLRLRSSSDCPSRCSRRHSSDSGEEEEEEESREENNEQEEQREEPERPPDISLENPPSYEAAVVKPPPYDLYHHLTPTQPRSAFQGQPVTDKKQQKSQFRGLPDFNPLQRPSLNDDDDDDVFLPTYQEALRLSFSIEKEPEEQQEQ